MLVYPSNPAEAVNSFNEAWNTGDDAERLLVLQTCCASDVEIAQAQGASQGVEALNAAVSAFLRAYPRAEVRFGVPEVHNGYVRVRWRTSFNDGSREPLSGEDFMELDVQNRIRRVVSFDGDSSEV